TQPRKYPVDDFLHFTLCTSQATNPMKRRWSVGQILIASSDMEKNLPLKRAIGEQGVSGNQRHVHFNNSETLIRPNAFFPQSKRRL
ncbi:MAG: hypothetical protein ABJC04_11465, partial [Verrucomicrobiota bacterium]